MPESSRSASGVAAGRYSKDTVDYEDIDVTRTADGGKHKEKVHYKHKEVEGSVAAQVQTSTTTTVPAAQCKDDSSWGCMWIVWVVLIFIIILIIVMAIFWAVKPSFVTRECEDDSGGCEVDLARAALYAFVITFFLVLIGCAIFYCCRR